MTCREKLKIEHPDEISEQYDGGCCGCPHTYGYLDPPDDCVGLVAPSEKYCRMCWDREIPEITICSCYDEQQKRCIGTKERDLCDCKGNELKCDFYPEKREKAELQNIPGMIYAEVSKPTKPQTEQPHILDSGTRREFESGAVRDIQEGKGRCDLLPLDVVCDIMDSDDVLPYIAKFVETSDTMQLQIAIGRFDAFLTWEDTFLEVSKHFEEGAKKYGEYNWQKGIPTHCYIDSAVRHYLKWLRGDQDEPHDRAFVWNILCCIWTCKHKPELNDYPKTEVASENN